MPINSFNRHSDCSASPLLKMETCEEGIIGFSQELRDPIFASILHFQLGKTEERIKQATRAFELDPLKQAIFSMSGQYFFMLDDTMKQ